VISGNETGSLRVVVRIFITESPMFTVDQYMTQYLRNDRIQQLAIVHDVMAGMQKAREEQDSQTYAYFLELSQKINDWHLSQSRPCL